MIPGSPSARNALAAAALCLSAVAAPGTVSANEAENLMGEWVVRPFDWQVGPLRGCRYRQTIDISQRTGPGRYRGLSVSGFTCNGLQHGKTRTPIEIEVDGRAVVLKSSSPSWMTETLKYVSPYRMEGKDALGHTMIYRRPKGPPTS